MVPKPAFVPGSTAARWGATAAGRRRGGVHGNVSNLAVVPLPACPGTDPPADVVGAVVSSEAALPEDERVRIERRQRRRRGRRRALERSRHATNTTQYGPGKR
ncbi:hypothetical protein [Actinomadura sp. CNU-125]|uniref:hypothetical protein n=1 Tax=Actinomadura sp. CNU-125 TaxID=1904961 RepID=UPI0011781101|nr:hypothetical protein [Actinomadura sp. CNU-125]